MCILCKAGAARRSRRSGSGGVGGAGDGEPATDISMAPASGGSDRFVPRRQHCWNIWCRTRYRLIAGAASASLYFVLWPMLDPDRRRFCGRTGPKIVKTYAYLEIRQKWGSNCLVCPTLDPPVIVAEFISGTLYSCVSAPHQFLRHYQSVIISRNTRMTYDPAALID